MVEHNKIIYFSLFCIILYLVCDKNIERMSEVSTDDKIRELINTIYKADVQSIRNLSDIALKLQGTNGKDLVLPGNFTIEGSLKVGKDTIVSGKTRLNNDLTVSGSSTVSKNSTVSGNSTVNGTSTLGSSLTVSGNSTVSGDSVIKGNSMISKNMTVDGHISSNKTRYIQIGNNRFGITGGHWDRYWSISEVQAFDKNGTDIALRKPVKQLKGVGLDQNRFPPSCITNGIIRGYENNQYFHGGGSNEQTLLEIDLGAEYYIKNIVITARWNGGITERQNGTHIETFNAARQSINFVQTGQWWNDLTKHINF